MYGPFKLSWEIQRKLVGDAIAVVPAANRSTSKFAANYPAIRTGASTGMVGLT